MSDDHFALPHERGRELLTAERATQLLPSADAVHYTRLTLSGHSFSLPAARVFAPAIAQLSSLTDADLSDIIAQRNTEEAVAVLDALCDAVGGHQLRSLNLSDNAIGARGVESVSRALRRQKGLQRLALNNDGLQGAAVLHVVQALLAPFQKGDSADDGHHPTCIRHVELYRNLLQDDGPRALVPLVRASPQLSHLTLSSSRVSSAGGLALVTALSTLSRLEHLNLSDSNLGPEAGLVLARALLVPGRTQRLTSLHLGDIGVNDRKESGEAIRAIIVALRSSCPKLQQLDLQSNDISARNARLLARSLRGKRALQHLNLEGHSARARTQRSLRGRSTWPLLPRSSPRAASPLCWFVCDSPMRVLSSLLTPHLLRGRRAQSAVTARVPTDVRVFARRLVSRSGVWSLRCRATTCGPRERTRWRTR